MKKPFVGGWYRLAAVGDIGITVTTASGFKSLKYFSYSD